MIIINFIYPGKANQLTIQSAGSNQLVSSNLITNQINQIKILVFDERGKPGVPTEKPLENQQTHT